MRGVPVLRIARVLAALAMIAGAGCAGRGTPGVPAAPAMGAPQADDVEANLASGQYFRACAHLVLGQWRCMAMGLRDQSQVPMSEDAGNGSVRGYGPAQLQAAYNITDAAKRRPSGRVAVVEMGGYPALEQDLAVYRHHFNLPPCDVASGCLEIVNEHGNRSHLPPLNKEWLSEQALDVDMVSANCPKCRILVVEATTSLFKAELTAAKKQPIAISNSWAGFEYPQERRAIMRVFYHPGMAITAAAGDGGYGTLFPAAAYSLTAVGGTELKPANNARGFSERAWSHVSSGCSHYVAPPKWQIPLEKQLGGCTNRMVSDVAYDASPGTGVAVYESMQGDGERPGWQVWGGTSVGAPAIAAMYALSGKTGRIPARLLYLKPSALYDITEGGFQGLCPLTYLCKAQAGYDGPTGNGTPNGLGAF